MSQNISVYPETNLPCRVSDLGLEIGILPHGKNNAITDVEDVRIGHFTLIEGKDIRTGATAILPHGGNIFQEKVPAGIIVGNGYGKMMGGSQILELGEIETPIILTNTLSVPQAAEALLDWTLEHPDNEHVQSINPVVGETNDGWLNNIRARKLSSSMIHSALNQAHPGPVVEGSIGAGTGTITFGWKGGIGTSSRLLPDSLGGFTIGVIVQSNFGGVFQLNGIPIGKELGQYFLKDELESHTADGSIMIIVATDAPISDRNLTRLAKRAIAGLARTGAAMSNGSGDFVIAFSNAPSVRRTSTKREKISFFEEIPNANMSPLFQGAIEATEEAIYNSMLMSATMSGYRGTIQSIPITDVKHLINKYHMQT